MARWLLSAKSKGQSLTELLSDTSELAALCKRLATSAFVTVDTEFLRETTFWPKLCVIQVASQSEAVVIDALAPGLDLTPFFDLMTNPDVVKVFHAARQDIEIIWKLSGKTPSPLFDTQVAAMVCGFGDQVSYEQLAASLASARIDKSSRFTDWSRRPLSDAQLDYALADVTHLRTVYEKLKDKLERNNRHDWLTEELSFLTSHATYEQKPEDAWQRLKGRIRKPKDLAILMELAAWREREAQGRDVPRSRILKDEAVLDIALSGPTTIEGLGRLRTIPQGFERSRVGADIIDCVEKGLARDPKSLPSMDRDRSRAQPSGSVVQLLKVLLQSVSEQNQVAAKLIATVEDLEDIAIDDAPGNPVMQGWRHDIFGSLALDLKYGRLALSMEKGKIRRLPLGQSTAGEGSIEPSFDEADTVSPEENESNQKRKSAI
jgi:ribonuclease D